MTCCQLAYEPLVIEGFLLKNSTETEEKDVQDIRMNGSNDVTEILID